MLRKLLTGAVLFTCWATVCAQDEDDPNDDKPTGLPSEYSDYLISSKTLSPDQRFAVIYPNAEVCADEPNLGAPDRCQDYLVALKPFQIVTKIDTKFPDFKGKSHGGMSAIWTTDRSAMLLTLESKWGPDDIFLYEFRGEKLSRSTNLLSKMHELLAPEFKKAKVERYNDYSDFIFEADDDSDVCEFIDTSHVKIKATATTDPKLIPGLKAWDAAVTATWDMAAARFLDAKPRTTFAGKRKGDSLD